MTKPTHKEVVAYQDRVTACTETKEIFAEIEGLLVSLGLPKDKFNDLETEHIYEILDLVLGKKK